MDREVKQLKQSRIPIVKVRWNSRRGPEFTWEREDFFMKKYPHLFPSKKRGRGDNRAPGRRSRKEGRIYSHSMDMLAFGMKMDEQALEPGTDEIRGKHGTGHYTGGARHDCDLRFKYR
ncbi:hypothetical protein Tco_1051874 [Tanacetum coccineum]